MISIFAGRNGSGQIRGKQIADFLGEHARLNPTRDFHRDICIYVKRQPPCGYPERSYLDIVDAHERIRWLKRHPKIGVIASSNSAQSYLRKILDRSDIRLIPQHHCNIARVRKEPQRPFRLGMVGGRASLPPEDFDVAWFGGYRTREDVVSAYLQIDVQVVWRLAGDRPLKNPLKLVNAASFGIPTIAYPEPSYVEFEGYYIPAKTKDEVSAAVRRLETEYEAWRSRLIAKAEAYHIERIAQLYEAL